MLALLRIILILPIVYLLACTATGFTIYGAWQSTDAAGQNSEFELILGALFVAMAFAATSFPASLIGIAVSEVMQLRSFVGYVLLGLLNGYVLSWIVADEITLGQFGEPFLQSFPDRTEIYLAGGAAWGLSYWILAGRNAGLGTADRTDSDI